MKKSILALSLLSAAATSNGANNPATTSYVDQQFAAAKASLVSLINSGSSVAHPVGSCYGGGIVFYVNTDPNAPAGQRGLIVALADASSSAEWDTSAPSTITTSKDYFKGLENTVNILATGTQSQYPAAFAANAYQTADTCDTCTNWYLPSRNELSTLYDQAQTSGSTFWTNTNCTGTAPGQTSYWSSTQYDTNNAWFAEFTGSNAGVVDAFSTTFQSGVRPVRAF